MIHGSPAQPHRGSATMLVLFVLLALAVAAFYATGNKLDNSNVSQGQVEANGGVAVPNPVKRPGTPDAFFVFPTGDIIAAEQPVVFRRPPPAWANEMVRNSRMVMEWRPEDRRDWLIWQAACSPNDCLHVTLREKAFFELNNIAWRKANGIRTSSPSDVGDAAQAVLGMSIR